ncbi:hypothetical protein P7C73_g1077, partial [Tremellales sp. Uapishka_1]
MSSRQQTFTPLAAPSSIVCGKEGSKSSCGRFTLLTEGLIRCEYSSDGQFEDRASTFAIHRDLETPLYRLLQRGDAMEIVTSKFHLTYTGGPFTANSLTLQVLGGVTDWKSRWRYGQPAPNLGGTSRTLDDVDGRMPLEPGVLSRNGYAVVDDSNTMLFDGDWVAGRVDGRLDVYVFAHGSDYTATMRDFFTISGYPPLLPRWALGNWWSRFYPYSDTEYLELMDKFAEEGIPLSVAVIDVDWHLITDEKVQETGSSGWTGYTWNDKLFPDPARFTAELRDRHLHITLNDHPADGICSFEDSYEHAGKKLGIDPTTKENIAFDPASKSFMDTFFEIVRRPLEKQGIDFWWCDWQQGEYSRIPGIDPLWVLNHYSFVDNALHGRPMHFSRYAGPGSHRYPVGFSGDTMVSWESLHFQPEYTASSSNIGYGWWSHDIGGHRDGKRDEELVTRWVQFGVFSPIMRLHSSAGLWTSKEAWSFGIEYAGVIKRYMRFRHKLAPYLYSMNVRASRGKPLCVPMYWLHGSTDAAYTVPNQYYFGSEMIVAPITTPRNHITGRAGVNAWLPPGRHVDIFTGMVYDGDRHIVLHRTIDDYPILAREGSIIPLDANDAGNGCLQVEAFEILLVIGGDGTFDIFEDDEGPAETMKERTTRLCYTHANRTFTVNRTAKVASLPNSRDWTVRLLASAPSKITCAIDGKGRDLKTTKSFNGLTIHIGDVPCDSDIVLTFGGDPSLESPDLRTQLQPIIHQAQIEFAHKQMIWEAVKPGSGPSTQLARLLAMSLDRDVLDCVLEPIVARTT